MLYWYFFSSFLPSLFFSPLSLFSFLFFFQEWSWSQDLRFFYLMNQQGFFSSFYLFLSYFLTFFIFSGLDSKSSRKTIELLKKLAKTKGKTILLTIHQSNSLIFQLFDKVMLLSGGNQVYYLFSSLIFFLFTLFFSFSSLFFL